MKPGISIIFISITISMCFLSCEGPEGEIGPAGPAGPALTGDLFGSIQTFDEFGTPLQDHSGVEVTVEGTDPVMETLTDSEGNYHFDDLTTGTYNLIFTKDKYQTQKIFSHQFIGGSIPTYITRILYLSTISTTSIKSFSVSITEENNPDTTRYSMVKVERLISPESTQEKPRQLKVYLSTSEDVSVDEYEYRLSMGTTGNSDIIRLDKLPKNTTFYAIMYPTPALCNPYYDPYLDQYNYSCYGTPSEVISFKVP